MGQWTAFRKWAAADAVMFVPQPTNAQAWLKGRANPAKSVEWWPTASYVSCDGGTAVNTGGWRGPAGADGFFTTVWHRQGDGSWRWLVDSGDKLSAPRSRPRTPRVVHASCTRPNPPYTPPVGAQAGAGWSPDHSLTWEWAFNATGHTRVLSVSFWNGKRYVDAFEDLTAVE